MKTKNKRPTFITVEEAAKIAKVCPRTIYRWMEMSTCCDGSDWRWSSNFTVSSRKIMSWMLDYNNHLWIDKRSFIENFK